MGTKILTIKNLNVSYKSSSIGIFKKPTVNNVIKNISLDIENDEFFGLVGESGCGKTTLGKAVLGLVPFSGEIKVSGQSYNRKNRKQFYKNVQSVFQDPMSALDPKHTIGFTMEEPLVIHKIGTKKEREIAIDEMLENIGLDYTYKNRLPSELSGGQRQRVCIGASLMLKPKLLVADEAISSLDVSVGAQILNLFHDLHEQLDFSMLFISHNLEIVYHICSRIAVMNKGQIIELGTAEEIYNNPKDEYTKTLLQLK